MKYPEKEWILLEFFKDEPWTFFLVNHKLKQTDAASCGVFTLKFIQCWAMGCRPKPLDVVIAKHFIAWEIALGKLANPINYAAFVKENKQAKEADGKEGLQEAGSNDVEQVEARQAESTGLCSSIPQGPSNKDSNKKLLILNLNGVLMVSSLSRRTRNRDFNFRPHCFEFLQVCFSYFVVAVWSSKLRHNIEPVLESISTQMKQSFEHKLIFVWPYNAIFPTSYTFLTVQDNYLDPEGAFV
ncbi:uncharacterized protein [Coffea arabica]|uniref:Mitochondrial import inner membrane translocase subunit TIM50 n=1 Tax=Coffea arabica TaxID=13443 RepID=A0ABM4X6C4_COFAR